MVKKMKEKHTIQLELSSSLPIDLEKNRKPSCITYVLVVRIARQQLVADSREHFCMGNKMLENRVAVNSARAQDFQHQLDFHLRTIPKSSFAVEKRQKKKTENNNPKLISSMKMKLHPD